MMYILDVSTESGAFILGESMSSESTNIQIFCEIENGGFDQNAVTITDPMGHAPQIFFQRRYAAAAGTSGLWRHFAVAVENAEGRKPVFKVSRQYRDGNGVHNLSTWKGAQTTDFVNWQQSNTVVLEGGSGGTYNIDFPNPLPAGRSYVAHVVYGRNEEAEDFAEWLLDENSSIATPADPSYVNGVFANSVIENGDLGQPIGDNRRYAIKLAFGGSTTDGKRKRKLILMYGIHAAGEAQAWWSFVESVKWLMSSSDTQAQNLRANWDAWLYFNANPNGIKGGYSRFTPRNSSIDPNRCWSDLDTVSPIEENDTLKRVMHADVGGACDAFLSHHGDVYTTNKFQAWVVPEDYSSGTRTTAMQAMIDAGTAIWGNAPTLSTSGTYNNDVWFGKEILKAPVSFCAECPSMGGGTVQYFAELGQNWLKALDVVDQAGGIVQGAVHDLAVLNIDQDNTASTGEISVTSPDIDLTIANVDQTNDVSKGAISVVVSVLTSQQSAWLRSLALLHGLVEGSPLSISGTSRSAGEVTQTISNVAGTVTVTTTAAPSGSAGTSQLTSQETQWLEDLAKIYGLIDPLTVTSSSRSSGSLTQAISTVDGTTTVTR